VISLLFLLFFPFQMSFFLSVIFDQFLVAMFNLFNSTVVLDTIYGEIYYVQA